MSLTVFTAGILFAFVFVAGTRLFVANALAFEAVLFTPAFFELAFFFTLTPPSPWPEGSALRIEGATD